MALNQMSRFLVFTTFLVKVSINSANGLLFSALKSISSAKPALPPRNVKILILPGFTNDSNDYTDPSKGSLVDSLEERGWDKSQISVLPVERSDWIKVFINGIVDWKYWLSEAPPNSGAYGWYLERIQKEVAKLKDDEKLVLLGHSAGGWLARAALGFANVSNGDNQQGIGSSGHLEKILGLVTLGTPHMPPPEGIMDVTRGALRITNEMFPGAFHDNMFYITVGGNAINGEKRESSMRFEAPATPSMAFHSYESVCGDGCVVGDGVVPAIACHLEGAIQISLDGVFHSVNFPEHWYGSTEKLDLWHDTLLEQVCRKHSFLGRTRRSSPSFLSDLALQLTHI